jgi:hypothetical protein
MRIRSATDVGTSHKLAAPRAGAPTAPTALLPNRTSHLVVLIGESELASGLFLTEANLTQMPRRAEGQARHDIGPRCVESARLTGGEAKCRIKDRPKISEKG